MSATLLKRISPCVKPFFLFRFMDENPMKGVANPLERGATFLDKRRAALGCAAV